MKKAIASAFFAIAAGVAINANAKDVTANIVNVTPVYSDCTQQTQVCDVVSGDQQQQSAVNPGSVIGGIAGALLGGHVGNGNGRVAMAALGAVTGALAGDRVTQRSSQPQPVCRWVQRAEQQISGYRVAYAYEGETYETVLPYDPSRGGSVSTVNVKMTLSMR
jgi:uncharacterized protein YcfJ